MDLKEDSVKEVYGNDSTQALSRFNQYPDTGRER